MHWSPESSCRQPGRTGSTLKKPMPEKPGGSRACDFLRSRGAGILCCFPKGISVTRAFLQPFGADYQQLSALITSSFDASIFSAFFSVLPLAAHLWHRQHSLFRPGALEVQHLSQVVAPNRLRFASSLQLHLFHLLPCFLESTCLSSRTIAFSIQSSCSGEPFLFALPP